MRIEAIGQMLGHETLRMTLIYARIANRTVADEYRAVNDQVDAFYDDPDLPGRRTDMTTVAAKPSLVTASVDTHLDMHVAAALDHLGGLLGTAQFPTTANDYRQRVWRWPRRNLDPGRAQHRVVRRGAG